MKAAVKRFAGFLVTGQLEFLKSGDFTSLERHEKIAFLKAALKEGLSPKTVTAILELLRELNYLDKFFFRQYQYHIDNSVANAAKKAIKQKIENNESTIARLTNMLREGNTDDRMLIANCFIEGGGKLNEDALISFLCFDDPGIRKTILNKITLAHELDESRLIAVLKNGSIVWYARAALVEILGKRKCKYLLDIVDYLLNDKNVDVKLKLIAALLQLKDESVKPYIQKLANDSIPWVRKEARRVLQAL
ncbi:MAG TPA: HEAT repeat domain-containing protein [Candidatus Deferrimicrobium sp.]|nr:HEAT repeat domain-containing protein [Candidatus Deferrimicrobium sp.]